MCGAALVGFYKVVVSRWRQREETPYAPSEAPTRWISSHVYYLAQTHTPTRNPSTLQLVGLLERYIRRTS